MGLRDKLNEALDAAGSYAANTAKRAGSGIKTFTVDGLGGLVQDLLIEPYEDAKDGFSLKNVPWRTAQALGQGVQDIGKGLEGAAGLVLSPVPGGADTILDPLAKAYDKVVDDPVATAATAASLADSKKLNPGEGWLGRMGNIFDGQVWSDAHKIVKTNDRTLGQALSLMLTDDIADQAEVAKFQKSKLFTLTSNTLDVVAPFLLDPAVAAGGVAGAARSQFVVKPIKTGDDISQIAASNRVQKIVAGMEGMDAAQIRHKYFPNEQRGMELSQVLADVETPAGRTLTLRAAMGDLSAVNHLQKVNMMAANQMRRMQGDRDALEAAGFVDRPWDDNGQMFLLASPDEYAKIDREIDGLRNLQLASERQQNIFATLENVPRSSSLNEARTALTRSEFYQNGKGAPLRVVYRMRPHGMVNLDDRTGDVQVARMLSRSALPPNIQDSFRSDYINAASSFERNRVLESAESASIQSILSKHGISKDDQVRILDMATKGKASTNAAIRQRAYDGENRSKVKLAGDGHYTHIPLLTSQNANLVTITDLQKLDRIAKRYSPLRSDTRRAAAISKGKAGDLGDDTLRLFYRAWKPASLLRVAYPIRVVGEEQLRLMSMFGAMTTMKYAKVGIANTIKDGNTIQARFAAKRTAREAELGRALKPAEAKALRAEIKTDFEANEQVRGYKQILVDDEVFEGPLAGSGRTFNTLLSSKNSFDRAMGRDIDKVRDLMDKELGDLRPSGKFLDSIKPGDISWGKAWLEAANRQIGQNAAARKILSGETDEQILDWLNTTEGAAYRRELHPHWRANPEDWIENARGQVESYLPTPALQAAALEGKATLDLMNKEVPDSKTRPIVHGEELETSFTGSTVVKALNRLVEKGYQTLATQPTDILSRAPAFNHAYKREVERQVALIKSQNGKVKLTPEQIEQIQYSARQEALGTVKKHMFDLAEESDLSHMLRYISPFFGAWQEVLTVWAGLTVNNPRFAAQMHNIWLSPERAGLVTEDDEGREYILLPIPEVLKSNRFFGGALRDMSDFQLDKRGLNTILTATPGVGPTVAVPTAILTKDRPDIREQKILQFLYPYGMPKGDSALEIAKNGVVTTTFRNLGNIGGDEDSRDTRNWYIKVYMTQLTDFQQGKRATPPDPEKIMDEVRGLQALRTIVSFISPAPTTFRGPYQPYIDIYRRMLETDPQNADEKFYDEYGPELYNLTVSTTKSINGVPATLDGWKGYEKNKDLIQEFPEYGSLIVGQVGDEFSQSVYEFQRQTPVAPGDSRKQRETLGLQDVVKQPEVEAGWIEFTRAMSIINAELDKRGLSNLQQKAAQDLSDLKKNVIAGLSEQYPAWSDAYGKADLNKWPRRIKALEEIASSPQFNERDDIVTLRDYLETREALVDELQSRKAVSLDAQSNKDLRFLWDSYTSDLVRQHPAFENIFYRFLDTDPLTEVA